MDWHVEVKGSGQPSHAFTDGGADLRDWTFVAPILANHCKVIANGGRGAGKSPDPTGDVNCVGFAASNAPERCSRLANSLNLLSRKRFKRLSKFRNIPIFSALANITGSR